MLSKRELCRDRTTWNSTQFHQQQFSVGVRVGEQRENRANLKSQAFFSPSQTPLAANCWSVWQQRKTYGSQRKSRRQFSPPYKAPKEEPLTEQEEGNLCL